MPIEVLLPQEDMDWVRCWLITILQPSTGTR